MAVQENRFWSNMVKSPIEAKKVRDNQANSPKFINGYNTRRGFRARKPNLQVDGRHLLPSFKWQTLTRIIPANDQRTDQHKPRKQSAHSRALVQIWFHQRSSMPAALSA